MPFAKFKGTIDAPYEQVYDLLVDKMENPKKYVTRILYSKILEKGDGYVIRHMYEPKPVDLTIMEKIYHHDVPGGQEFIYEHMNNPTYTGIFRNILTRVGDGSKKVELEYIMDWKPKPGMAEKMTDAAAAKACEFSINHMKTMAEHPVKVPAWVRDYYRAVDSMNPDAKADLLADSCTFRMGNGPEIVGRDNIIQASRDVISMFAGIRHDFAAVDETETKTFVDCYVEYTLQDKSKYLLLFLTAFERKSGKITRIKVNGDLSPLKYGWGA